MARDDWTVLVTDRAREYEVRCELQRFDDFHLYIPQSRRPWRVPGGGERVKLCPVFGRVLLLPESEASSPILRDIGLIKTVSLRIPPAVISQFLLREALREFDHERPQRPAHQRRQARVDREITNWLPRRHFGAMPGESDGAIERFVGRLAAIAGRAAPAVALHGGA